MLVISYGEGAVYGRVVHCDAPDTPRTQLRGLYLKVLDREVSDGDDLAEVVASSPVLLGPFFTINDPIKKKTWRVVGNVPPDERERDLPLFMGSRGFVDYFHRPVPETPENEARLIQEVSFPPHWVEKAVRAKRGLEEWMRGYDRMNPGGG
jgi:hypothetical protein